MPELLRLKLRHAGSCRVVLHTSQKCLCHVQRGRGVLGSGMPANRNLGPSCRRRRRRCRPRSAQSAPVARRRPSTSRLAETGAQPPPHLGPHLTMKVREGNNLYMAYFDSDSVIQQRMRVSKSSNGSKYLTLSRSCLHFEKITSRTDSPKHNIFSRNRSLSGPHGQSISASHEAVATVTSTQSSKLPEA